VETFGQTGSIAELYKSHGLDCDAIIEAAQRLAPGRPARHRKL
jgi:pyruvate dehydrogenase E1 component